MFGLNAGQRPCMTSGGHGYLFISQSLSLFLMLPFVLPTNPPSSKSSFWKITLDE